MEESEPNWYILLVSLINPGEVWLLGPPCNNSNAYKSSRTLDRKRAMKFATKHEAERYRELRGPMFGYAAYVEFLIPIRERHRPNVVEVNTPFGKIKPTEDQPLFPCVVNPEST